jgi:hypothetical protein
MNFREKLKKLPPRTRLALACYGILVLVGLSVLLPVRNREEQFLLAMFLAIFAILAVKTIARTKMDE